MEKLEKLDVLKIHTSLFRRSIRNDIKMTLAQQYLEEDRKGSLTRDSVFQYNIVIPLLPSLLLFFLSSVFFAVWDFPHPPA